MRLTTDEGRLRPPNSNPEHYNNISIVIYK